MGKPVIGLIGGIGSGKSRVAAEFARRGAVIIAGDQLGHEALRQPEIKARVVDRWGPAALDAAGEIDRRKLGAAVFADPAERKALEAMVQPSKADYIGFRFTPATCHRLTTNITMIRAVPRAFAPTTS